MTSIGMELVLVHRFLSLLKLGNIKILNLLKLVEDNSCMSLNARDNVVKFHTTSFGYKL